MAPPPGRLGDRHRASRPRRAGRRPPSNVPRCSVNVAVLWTIVLTIDFLVSFSYTLSASWAEQDLIRGGGDRVVPADLDEIFTRLRGALERYRERGWI